MAKKAANKEHSLKTGSLLAETKRRLRQSGLKARKRLGQHFLVDEAVLETITAAPELTAADVVIEIGPGLGILTKQLAQQAGWVVAIELDNKLAARLQQTLAEYDNVIILNQDILKIDPAALLLESIDSPFSYKVVANLPYYITSPVLRHFLEAKIKPQIMVVMVQKEIAKAIVARPGQMSLLSVSVQFYGQPRIISYVPASCFYPVPEVDSAILRLDLYPQPAVAITESDFFKLVRAGFTASRKQLTNSLVQGLGLAKAEVLLLLKEAGITPQRRAETLNLDEWARLWQVFHRDENADINGAG